MKKEEPDLSAGLSPDDESNDSSDLSWSVEEINEAMQVATSRLFGWCKSALSVEPSTRQERLLKDLLEMALRHVPRTADEMPAAMPITGLRARGDAELQCRFCGYTHCGNPLGEPCQSPHECEGWS